MVVTAVDPEGPAAHAGVDEGDLLLELDGHEVNNVDNLRKAVEEADLQRGVRLYVETRYGPIFLLMRQDD